MSRQEIRSIEDVRATYRMTADYHTHTTYSHGWIYAHGKGSIEENVAAAEAKGLREIAITDHGPGHIFYGLKLRKLEQMRQDIAEAAERHPGVRILLGVEANTMDTENGLDVDRRTAPRFDMLIAGYHYGVLHSDMIPNHLYWHLGQPAGSAGQLRLRNTERVLRALYENDLRILTHPCDKGAFDLKEICRACEETHTLMEISTRHTHLTTEEIRVAADYDVRFVISSDAHRPEQVGTYEAGVLRAIEAGLDLKRIVNIEQRSPSDGRGARAKEERD